MIGLMNYEKNCGKKIYISYTEGSISNHPDLKFLFLHRKTLAYSASAKMGE